MRIKKTGHSSFICRRCFITKKIVEDPSVFLGRWNRTLEYEYMVPAYISSQKSNLVPTLELNRDNIYCVSIEIRLFDCVHNLQYNVTGRAFESSYHADGRT